MTPPHNELMDLIEMTSLEDQPPFTAQCIGVEAGDQPTLHEYYFTVRLWGSGATEDDAWVDATDSFSFAQCEADSVEEKSQIVAALRQQLEWLRLKRKQRQVLTICPQSQCILVDDDFGKANPETFKDNQIFQRYEFTVELRGIGSSQAEAWADAAEAFSLDPGEPHTVELLIR
jgi:hypothetical protein